jgi:hypothetical protein
MELSKEIYERFFSRLLEDNAFSKSFVSEMRKLIETGPVNQETLRNLIEAQDSNESKD